MRTIHVLYLDVYSETYIKKLERDGDVQAMVTTLWSADITRPTGYKVSQFGRDYARRATPDQYDLIVIGDNAGTGCYYAELIPAEMASRTLIVWDDNKEGDKEWYIRQGYEHFCSREHQVEYLLKMLGEKDD